jgi:hypothetical protein
MRPSLFIAFILLCAAAAAHAQAYRWVDENGVVHYSDRPQPGAEAIVLPDSTTRTRPVAPRRPGSQPDTTASAGEDDAQGYTSFAVTSPAAEETLWNIAGNLNVSLTLEPALMPGHRIRVYLDGEETMVTGTSFQLEEVFRGAHNIQAEVVDATGRMLIRSQPIRFYVQQTSVQNRARATPGPR